MPLRLIYRAELAALISEDSPKPVFLEPIATTVRPIATRVDRRIALEQRLAQQPHHQRGHCFGDHASSFLWEVRLAMVCITNPFCWRL